MKILVSSCLLGENVKYSGGNNFSENLIEILKKYDMEVIKICPEVMGGLNVPRKPAEIKEKDIVTNEGKSVKKEFYRGAEKVLELAKEMNIKFAVLKEKSPSCGKKFIYDGSFSKNLIKGQGITTALLKKEGIKIFSEEELEELEKILLEEKD